MIAKSNQRSIREKHEIPREITSKEKIENHKQAIETFWLKFDMHSWLEFLLLPCPSPSNLIWEEVRAVMREENTKKKKKKLNKVSTWKNWELKYKILAFMHMLKDSFIFYFG